jgi:hypothetical protein
MKRLLAASSFLFAVATAAQTARMPSQAETIAAELLFCGRNAGA